MIKRNVHESLSCYISKQLITSDYDRFKALRMHTVQDMKTHNHTRGPSYRIISEEDSKSTVHISRQQPTAELEAVGESCGVLMY